LATRAKTPERSSFADIGYCALGKPGKIAVEILLVTSQIGFVMAGVYFISSQLQEVVQTIFY
jgi:amino acid permease